jgi:hypothetical protein
MRYVKVLAATSMLVVSACGLPIPFEYQSEVAEVDLGEILDVSNNGSLAQFGIPEGAPEGANSVDEIKALLAEFLGADVVAENWPAELDAIKIDIPLLHEFPIDISEQSEVQGVSDNLDGIAVDTLAVDFQTNDLNYAIPDFHFLIVDEGVTLPAASELDLGSLPTGVTNIGFLTGLAKGETGSFGLEYNDGGKRALSDALLALKFRLAIFTTLTFDSSTDDLFPSGKVKVQANIAGRLIPAS